MMCPVCLTKCVMEEGYSSVGRCLSCGGIYTDGGSND